MKVHVTTLAGEQAELEYSPGQSLMQLLAGFEDGVAAQCGGLMQCGTCHVYVMSTQDKLPPRSQQEADLLVELDSLAGSSRLSCQIVLQPEHDGLKVTIAPPE